MPKEATVMNKMKKLIQEVIQSGSNSEIHQMMVEFSNDTHEFGYFVRIILSERNTDPDVVGKALKMFSTLNINKSFDMEDWVCALSNFSHLLWKFRLDEWTKKLYEIALKDAREASGNDFAMSLVNDFLQYSKFGDNPMDYGITPEKLLWVEGGCGRFEYEKRRIDEGIFGKND